jgi:hypothetical protein
MAKRLEREKREKFIFQRVCLPILKSDLCRTIFVHIYLIYVKKLQSSIRARCRFQLDSSVGSEELNSLLVFNLLYLLYTFLQ